MIKVKRIKIIYRVLDYLMIPLMFMLGGFKRDSIQETHKWHGQKIDAALINKNISVKIVGTDDSNYKNHGKHFGLFHMPLFGGWKDYIVLENRSSFKYWHAGWINQGNSAEIHLLPIYDKEIKLLKGKKGANTYFFAIDENGNQNELKCVGEGKLGDNKYPSVRLF